MEIIWHNEKRRVNELIPYEHNPRQMTEKQVEDLKASLQKFNLVEVPAINTDNMILAGHQRMKILQLLGRGDEEIDVRVPSRTLTPDEVREYNIRSNANTGSFDFGVLANSFGFEELVDWGFDKKELEKGFGVGKPEEPTGDGCERCEELRKAVQGHKNHSGHEFKLEE